MGMQDRCAAVGQTGHLGHAIARACGPSSQSADRGPLVEQQLLVTTAAEGPRRADNVPFLIHLTTKRGATRETLDVVPLN